MSATSARRLIPSVSRMNVFGRPRAGAAGGAPHDADAGAGGALPWYESGRDASAPSGASKSNAHLRQYRSWPARAVAHCGQNSLVIPHPFRNFVDSFADYPLPQTAQPFDTGVLPPSWRVSAHVPRVRIRGGGGESVRRAKGCPPKVTCLRNVRNVPIPASGGSYGGNGLVEDRCEAPAVDEQTLGAIREHVSAVVAAALDPLLDALEAALDARDAARAQYGALPPPPGQPHSPRCA